jgi:hypothetical protein
MQNLNGAAPAVYERLPWEQTAPQWVRFYTNPVYDRVRSEREGTPIIDPKVYIEFPRAGEVDVLRREATEIDKRRFPDQWKAYQESRQDMPVGTPLATLFPGFPERVELLRFFKCYTVEQLAEMSEHGVQKIGLGGFEWRKKAQDFIATAQSSKGYHQLHRAIEDRDATIAALEAKIAALGARIDESKQPAAPAVDIQALIEAAVNAKLAAVVPQTTEPAAETARARKPKGGE